jgi:hypothetical protein
MAGSLLLAAASAAHGVMLQYLDEAPPHMHTHAAGSVQCFMLNMTNLPPPPHLAMQEVGLDTAFLPSLSELVGAARAANIPTTGPGAITSLCSLDQAVGDANQLACLSHLSSLAGVWGCGEGGGAGGQGE